MSRTAALVVLFWVAQQFALPQTTTPPEAASGSPASSAPAPTSPDVQSLLASPTSLSEDQIRAIIQKVADNDIENNKKLRNYTYIRREEDRRLNSKGEVQSTETRTYEVLNIYGSEVDRLIAKNDQPLSPKDKAKEEDKIQKIIDKREHETEAQRKKRLAQEEKDREEGRQWVREISDAYNFRLVGVENIAGRDNYVVDAEPRPGFQPHLKYANYLPKFRFRVWLDKADLQMVKLDAECIDNLSWGLFLARLHKGAHVLVEQTRVNDEVWLPKHEQVKADARVALLKTFRFNEDVTYRDYKKFRTDTKIVPMGEVEREQEQGAKNDELRMNQ
jgi:hypothetical protein